VCVLDSFALYADAETDTIATPTIPGAYADGVHNDAAAIQSVIDNIANLGGGIVTFAHGQYLSGPFTLKSNITLYIDSTSTILASQNVHLYYSLGADTTKPATSLQNFISSKNANNITITGYGTIDGQGSPWWAAENVAKAHGADTLRPRLIEIDNGSHIVITHITTKNAPMFNICPNTCYDVLIDSVTITAPSNSPNTDGIDPGKCHHVRITHCTISNGDDNVAVGSSSASNSWPDAASSDIIISHCTFGTGHGVSIGSYTSGGVDTMLVDSCTFSGTTNGIRIKSARSRGGNVRNITYSNLTMTNVQYPIYFTEYYPSIPNSDTAQAITSASETPYFHNLTLKNIAANNSSSNSMAGYIVGVPEEIMDNIHFQYVSIKAYKGLEVRNAKIDTVRTSISVSSGSAYILQSNGSITTLLNGVKQETTALPEKIQLLQNYPNPFNPSTTVSFNLPMRSFVSLKVFDLNGREVATIISEEMSAGSHSRQWNANNLTSGIYFCRLQASLFTETKKLILLR
jgi:polygalacturonase